MFFGSHRLQEAMFILARENQCFDLKRVRVVLLKTLLKPANHLSMFSVAADFGNSIGLLLSATAKPPTPAAEFVDLKNFSEISRHLGFRHVSSPEIQRRGK